MPIFHVNSPDGRTVEVTAPEGASEQDAIQYAKDNWDLLSKSSIPTTPYQVNPNKSQPVNPPMSFWDKAGMLLGALPTAVKSVSTGISEPIIRAGTGMIAVPISQVSGIGQIGLHATGLSERTPADVQNAVQEQLTYQPTTKTGLSESNPINYGMNAIGTGVNYLKNTIDAPVDPITISGMTRNAAREGIVQGLGIIPATKTFGKGVNLGLTGIENARQIVRNTSPFQTQANRLYAQGKTLNVVGGELSPEIITALENAKPGETAMQAAVPAGSTEFSAFGGKTLNRYAPTTQQAIKDAQEAARIEQLRSIGRDKPSPDDPKTNLELAISSRNKVANNLYGEAMAADDIRLNTLAEKAQISKGGIEQGTSGEIPLHPAVEKIAQDSTIQDIANEALKRKPELGNPLVSLRGLDEMLNTINDDLRNIASKNPTNLAKATERNLLASKNKILEAIQGTDKTPGLSPKYDAARRIYADMSTPINQMKIGQILEDSLASTMEGGSERSALFKNKIKAAEQLIKNTTGQQRYDSLSKLFTKEQMAKIDDIVAQLDRDSRLNELASSGSAKINAEVEAIAGKTPLGVNVMNREWTIAQSLINRAKGIHGTKTLSELAVSLQDPIFTAKLMKDATQRELDAISRIKSLTNVGQGALTIGARNRKDLKQNMLTGQQ